MLYPIELWVRELWVRLIASEPLVPEYNARRAVVEFGTTPRWLAAERAKTA